VLDNGAGLPLELSNPGSDGAFLGHSRACSQCIEIEEAKAASLLQACLLLSVLCSTEEVL